MTTKWTSFLRFAGVVTTLTVLAIAVWILGAHVARAANASVGAGNSAGDTVFVPNVVTVSAGDSVTFNWVNGIHDTRNAATDQIYLPLSTGTNSQTTTFATAGTYYFYCSIHAKAADATDANIAAGTKMVGKIIVTAASAPASTTPATPTAATATPPTATPATPTTVAPNTVTMPGDYFSPATLVVKPGDTVTFKNQDSDPHTVTSVPGNAPAAINLAVKPGDSATFTFTAPGLYWYYCTAHAQWDAATGQVKANATVDDPSEPMEGFILVLAPATAPTSATVNIPTGTTNNDSFRPVVTTVQAGSVVTFNNADTDLHDVTTVPGNAPEKVSLAITSGQSASFTFKTPGLYWYYCDVHADFDKKTGQLSAHDDVDQPSEPMMGVVAVLAAPPPPPPTPTTPAPTTAPATPTTAPRPPSTGTGSVTDTSGNRELPWIIGATVLMAVATGAAATSRRR
jgi:plastocyanin